MTLPRIVFWVAMVAWGLTEWRYATAKAAEDRTLDRGSFTWAMGGALGGLAAALALDAVVPPFVDEDEQGPFLLAGTGVVLTGVAFRAWSVRVLGRFFTYQVSIRHDHEVVTDGPFRVLAHPSYTGLLLSCLGAGIAAANPASLLAVLVLPPIGIVRRIRTEEHELTAALGAPYEDFLQTRKRLVPGVW